MESNFSDFGPNLPINKKEMDFKLEIYYFVKFLKL